MKIIQYNDTYKHTGGAETYCMELLDQLDQLGHEVYWMAHGSDAPLADNHLVLPHFNEGRLNTFYSKYVYNKKAYQALKAQLEAIQPDVVHLHHNRYYTYSIFQALKDLKIPTIATVHDYTMLCPSQYYPDLYYKKEGEACSNRRSECGLICSEGKCLPMTYRIGHKFFHDRKRKAVCAAVERFIAPSTQLKSYLERAGFENVHHLPFFIDEKKWSFNAARAVNNVVLFIGRVEANKGIYYLMDSVIALRKEIPDIQLVIVGLGSQYEPVLEKIKQENLGAFIRATGFVPYETIATYYDNANVLVVPSIDTEQFGLVGIEGLASGIAVIGSDIGGIPEWCISEQTGLLFDPEQPHELTLQIRRMLQEKNLAKRLTTEGIKFVKKVYNLEKHFEGLLTHYQAAQPLI